MSAQPRVSLALATARYLHGLIQLEVAHHERQWLPVKHVPGVERLVVGDKREVDLLHQQELALAIDEAKAPPPACETAKPHPLRFELSAISTLIASAQTTLNVDDFGDALHGAQLRLHALIDQLEGKPEARGQEVRGQGASLMCLLAMTDAHMEATGLVLLCLTVLVAGFGLGALWVSSCTRNETEELHEQIAIMQAEIDRLVAGRGRRQS